jgi:hypothetical protein
VENKMEEATFHEATFYDKYVCAFFSAEDKNKNEDNNKNEDAYRQQN